MSPLLCPASQTRMVAAEATLSMTPDAVTLLSFLRAHKSLFSPGVGYNATSSALMRKNDTGKSAVPAEELDTNAYFLPGKAVGEALLAHWDEVVEAGRASLAASLPGVSPDSDVGKVLYYDVVMLLRIISYGVLVQNVNFLHENNTAMLVALYDVRWRGVIGAHVVHFLLLRWHKREGALRFSRAVSWPRSLTSTSTPFLPHSWRRLCSFGFCCLLCWWPASGFCFVSPQEMSVPSSVMPTMVRAMKDATVKLIDADLVDGTSACFEEVAQGLGA